jgi:predicted nucleic acid-binding protein
MKPKIYIETSVVSYLVSRPSKNVITAGHQAVTRDFWDTLRDFDVYISDMVIQEAAAGDETQAEQRLHALMGFPLLEITDGTKSLARALLDGKAVPEKCIEDAVHIAIAAINGIDVIVTWNFKHINNPITRMKIRHVIESNGLVCPEICSPDEFMGEDE